MRQYPYTVAAGSTYPSLEWKGPFEVYDEGLYSNPSHAQCMGRLCKGRGAWCQKWCNARYSHPNGHDQVVLDRAHSSHTYHVKMAMHYLEMADRALSALSSAHPMVGLTEQLLQKPLCIECQSDVEAYCDPRSSNAPSGVCKPGYCDNVC
ncbi:MAG: hypothetical protein S4CHLAM102_14770 [Chlamydiia bacterium]|nr:hypothetical protein [Chlamydiia bacterium]